MFSLDRSFKLLAMSPDRLPPAGSEKIVSSDDKRQLRESANLQEEIPKVPKGPVRYRNKSFKLIWTFNHYSMILC